MLTNQSQFDTLTGLPGRHTFDRELSAAIARAEVDEKPLSVAFVDIDRFEELNRDFGHAGGDAILQALSEALRNLSEDATAFRYGGDEFAIILKDLEREQAFLRLEAVRAGIEQIALQVGDTSIPKGAITMSGGVAAYPIDGSSLNELFRKADGALYRAKSTGRNKIALAYEERMSPKTSHYTLTQLERLSELAKEQGVGEAVLLREALDDLLSKYKHSFQIFGRQ